MSDTIKIIRIVFDFIDRCSEKELDDLVSGKAKFKIQYSKRKNKSKSIINTRKILSELDSFTSVEEAKEYFVSKNFTKAVLRQIAEKNNVVLLSKDTNEQIIDKIIELIIGSTLRYNSLLNMDTR